MLKNQLNALTESIVEEASKWDVKTKKFGDVALHYVKYDGVEAGWLLQRRNSVIFVFGGSCSRTGSRAVQQNLTDNHYKWARLSLTSFKKTFELLAEPILQWSFPYYTAAQLIGTYKGEPDVKS